MRCRVWSTVTIAGLLLTGSSILNSQATTVPPQSSSDVSATSVPPFGARAFEVWPKTISPAGGPLILYVDTGGKRRQVTSGLYHRKTAESDWEYLLSVTVRNGSLIVAQGSGPRNKGTEFGTDISYVGMIMVGPAEAGSQYRLWPTIINVDANAKPFKYFKPQNKTGRSCEETSKALRNGRIAHWTGESWTTDEKQQRTCGELEPGLYRALNKKGQTIQYFAVAPR
jgi:hypothetical protein